MISIVTPTYNRKNKLKRSMSNSLQLIKNIGGELIVVDDASSDDTVDYLKTNYSYEMESGKLKIFTLKQNIGVTGAKNYGANQAQFDWVVFMDSDDTFLPNISESFLNEFERLNEFDLIFFRCIDMQTKQLIGSEANAYELTFEVLLNNGTPGECLPVVKRDAILKFPYPTDLRCCESMAYKEMLFNSKKAYISDLAVREYDASGNDRLSLFSSRVKRANQLFRYFLSDIRYFRYLSNKNRIKTFVRILYYKTLSSFTRKHN